MGVNKLEAGSTKVRAASMEPAQVLMPLSLANLRDALTSRDAVGGDVVPSNPLEPVTTESSAFILVRRELMPTVTCCTPTLISARTLTQFVTLNHLVNSNGLLASSTG